MSTLFSCLFFCASFTNPQPLTVQVYNIQQAKGFLCLAIYDSATHFPKDEGALLYRIVPITSTDDIDIQIPDLTGTTYSVAIYQDLNGNQAFDSNLMGIPKEPYGFSNNPKVKWQEPTFEETAFRPSDLLDTSLRIRLASWEEQ